MADTLHIPPARAEEMKRDLGAAARVSPAAGKIAISCASVFEPLVNELKYSFNMYKSSSTRVRPIERMVLTGGGAALAGLAEFLTATFAVRAFIGNPWEQVNFHADLKPLLQSLGPRLTVALGLALRPL
jgi:Tfp pilus assembly PilM family ATPase